MAEFSGVPLLTADLKGAVGEFEFLTEIPRERSNFPAIFMNLDSQSDTIGRVAKKAGNNAKPVSFFHLDGSAKKVSVVGDFNNWDPEANVMERRLDGSWHTIVHLNNGHHRYMLNVDGSLVEDPKAHGIVRNEEGQRVCMVAVSGF